MTATPPHVVLRAAERADVPALFGLIRELAEYERLSDAVTGDEARLEASLFDSRAAEALLAEVDSEPVGYAIYFTTFSSFLCLPGLWLEDVFVRPGWRRRGIGGALLSHVAGVAAARGYGRLEWAVLDWNEAAMRFYRSIDAQPMDEWRTLRLDGDRLRRIAENG